jgi:hypothetical protein
MTDSAKGDSDSTDVIILKTFCKEFYDTKYVKQYLCWKVVNIYKNGDLKLISKKNGKCVPEKG